MKVIGVVCPSCKQFIFSRARHDCHYCKCGDIYVDGGFECMRVGFMKAVPKTETREVPATKKELYDDWNKGTDLYGSIDDGSTTE